MTLQLTMNAAQTEITIVSDRRKHAAVPAQTQNARITVESLDPQGEVIDGQVLPYTLVIKPSQPAYVDPLRVTDDSGIVWNSFSDDGVTAVYRRAV